MEIKETITITKEKYQELVEAQDFLYALQAAGVDNWDGYDFARDSYNELQREIK